MRPGADAPGRIVFSGVPAELSGAAALIRWTLTTATRHYASAGMFGGRCSLKCPTIVVASQS
jgi:hypothetical protein